VFHIHKWNKWEVFKEGNLSAVDKKLPGEWQYGEQKSHIIGLALFQKRTCEKCGKTEIDVQEVYI